MDGCPTRVFLLVTLHFPLARVFFGGERCTCEMTGPLRASLFILPGAPAWLGAFLSHPKA